MKDIVYCKRQRNNHEEKCSLQKIKKLPQRTLFIAKDNGTKTKNTVHCKKRNYHEEHEEHEEKIKRWDN